jgi:mannosyltransferase OCH1-like enzyme
MKPYPRKSFYTTVIPLNIFQTWHTKKLPALMQQNVNKIIENNPAFKYYLFDDTDCRNFIKDNFNKEILNTFDSLLPGAYKADLWRYCVLYIHGGIYLDIKYGSFNNFKFINLTEREHFVLDIDGYSVYNALMVCLPHNNKLLTAIHKIVFNVKTKNYGINCLHPTGPRLLGDIISYNEKKTFDMYHKCLKNKVIFLNGYIVLKSYDEYASEQSKNAKTGHYSSLWAAKRIYA